MASGENQRTHGKSKKLLTTQGWNAHPEHMLRLSHPESNSCWHFEWASPVTQPLASESAGFSIWMTRHIELHSVFYISAKDCAQPASADTASQRWGNEPASARQSKYACRYCRSQSILAVRTCTVSHTSEPYIRSQFSPIATTTPACMCQWSRGHHAL